MNISVVVPTYRRPEYLARCLRGLQQQTRPAEQILVVVRDSDTDSQSLLKDLPLPLEVVIVTVPGQVAALNAGLDRVTGDIVAITDDDAVPTPEWLHCIERYFKNDDLLAGVGGRDRLHDGRRYTDSAVVGKIQWFGRHIGNHHRGVGPARFVDVLKGANMSYRMSAVGSLRFDTRLLGAGAQICNDMAFSLRLKRLGWRLIYDPAVLVDHFSAERLDDDRRECRSSAAVRNEAHNETIAIWEYLPPLQRVVYFLWAIVIGHRSLPGPVQCVRLAALGHPSWSALKPVLTGRMLGARTLVLDRRRRVRSAS